LDRKTVIGLSVNWRRDRWSLGGGGWVGSKIR